RGARRRRWRGSVRPARSKRSHDSSRKPDRHEEGRRIEVVLTRLVDDAHHPHARRLAVIQTTVELAHLERGRVATVLHADDVAETIDGIVHDRSRRMRLILGSNRPRPWASYQCTSARESVAPSLRTRAVPFSLRQRPGP